MKPNVGNDMDFLHTIDYSDDVQYSNAAFAIGRIETDKGGIDMNLLWEETENIRRLLLQTPADKRPGMIEPISRDLKKKYEGLAEDHERTQMCILIVFALRLIKASKTKEENPHSDIIRAIVRLVSYRAKRDQCTMEALKELVKTIDADGDENVRRGRSVEFGVDILAGDLDWNHDLSGIIEMYKQKADTAGIIQYGKAGDAFDAVWDDLLGDAQFVNEMRESTLGKDYNLLLIFNVYGLLFPWAYSTSKVRGAKGIAKHVGFNPDSRAKNQCYSKDYFSTNEIVKLNQGIRSEHLLKHIQKIINKHKPQE